MIPDASAWVNPKMSHTRQCFWPARKAGYLTGQVLTVDGGLSLGAAAV